MTETAKETATKKNHINIIVWAVFSSFLNSIVYIVRTCAHEYLHSFLLSIRGPGLMCRNDSFFGSFFFVCVRFPPFFLRLLFSIDLRLNSRVWACVRTRDRILYFHFSRNSFCSVFLLYVSLPSTFRRLVKWGALTFEIIKVFHKSKRTTGIGIHKSFFLSFFVYCVDCSVFFRECF